MPAAVRSYLTAGLAVVGAGAMVTAGVTPPIEHSQARIVEAAVSLAASVGSGNACTGYNIEGCDIWATPTYTPVAFDNSGSAANIAANIVNAVISIPRTIIDSLNELSYGLEVTGSWWVYTPTNVLGFDPADPPKVAALVNLLYPFKPLANVIAEHTIWWGRSNLPMNKDCTGTAGPVCTDVGPIFSSMFLAPTWDLEAGYRFPTVINPVSDAEGAIGNPIPGSEGREMPWSNAYVKLNPFDAFNAVANYFLADPAKNTPKPVTLAEVGATLKRFVDALVLNFNPFVPMSFLLKGWPYTALTPLFKPFLPVLCPSCNPTDPALPPVPPAQSAAATEAPAVTVSTPAAPVADSATALAPTVASVPTRKRGKAPAVQTAAPAPAAAAVDAAPIQIPVSDSGPTAGAADTAPAPSTRGHRGQNRASSATTAPADRADAAPRARAGE